ncbi:MAG TPA: hypothetical protein VEZ88_10535 [Steroidobacteraceae bacterium]|nr:hypothetical protein [Steroidobacteraceae bacterium]
MLSPTQSALCRSSLLAASIAATLLGCAGTGDAAEREDTAITIYSSAQPGAIPPELYRPIQGMAGPSGIGVPGYAVVRHERPVTLSAGRSQVRFVDVAALIDPTTVQFSSLTDPDNTRVLEQNFQFDLVSTQKLLLKYIDKPLTLERVVGDHLDTLSGTLLSAANGLVLRGNDGQIYAVGNYSNIRFPELPGGLITRPTLEWDITAKRAGEHRARVAYQTGGITWWADYNLTFSEGSDANSGLLDVGAWVSILNQSGAGYTDARLKLIAGDVHRAEPQALPMAKRAREMMSAVADESAGFNEKAFFEFHLYTLGRRATLPDNSTKQIELFEVAHRVPAHKTLVYYGQGPIGYWYADPVVDRNFGNQSNRKVDVYLEFKNEQKAGLGIPLPAGRIRVSQADKADGTLEFIGEDIIDHTPKDEKVLVKLGSAFDVVGERRQVDFSVNTSQKWLEEEIEIKLRNHKTEPVEVIVKENLYRWSNWQIKTSSQSYEKEDARTIHFPVKVANDGETIVRYRVRYTW